MHDENINTDNKVTKKDAAAPLVLEPDDYRHHLDDFDLTEEQQNELLETLWSIMSIFVDIGWGVDTVQMFFPDIFAEVAPDSEKLLESKDASEIDQTATTQER